MGKNPSNTSVTAFQKLRIQNGVSVHSKLASEVSEYDSAIKSMKIDGKTAEDIFIVDINEARKLLNRNPLVAEGAVYDKVQGYRNSAGQAYTSRNRPLTGAPIENANIYVVITSKLNASLDEETLYNIVVDSEEGKSPLVCPLTLWHYSEDGKWKFESGRDWGEAVANAPGSNMNSLIPHIMKTLKDIGHTFIPTTTRMSFPTLEAHNAWLAEKNAERQQSRSNYRAQQGTRSAASPQDAPVPSGSMASPSLPLSDDPFAE